jgi:hypothetical protein
MVCTTGRENINRTRPTGTCVSEQEKYYVFPFDHGLALLGFGLWCTVKLAAVWSVGFISHSNCYPDILSSNASDDITALVRGYGQKTGRCN